MTPTNEDLERAASAAENWPAETCCITKFVGSHGEL